MGGPGVAYVDHRCSCAKTALTDRFGKPDNNVADVALVTAARQAVIDDYDG